MGTGQSRTSPPRQATVLLGTRHAREVLDTRNVRGERLFTCIIPVTPPVPPPVLRALGRLRAVLERRFGARLRELVLYGSHARGQAHDESDVDVLVVVEGLTEDERREVFDLAYEADAAEREAWVGLSTLVYSTDQVAEMRARERLLLRDIDREGIRV